MYLPLRFALFLLLIIVAPSARAEDQALTELHASLQSLRGYSTPDHQVVTKIKHRLRDWIEAQLPWPIDQEGLKQFEDRLNDRLSQADLFCDFNTSSRSSCFDSFDWLNERGFLGGVSITEHLAESRIVVVTRVGDECGEDESAYLYQWNGAHWQRLWQSEQTTQPQSILAVLIGQFRHRPIGRGTSEEDFPVLTLGNSYGCSSNWRTAYFRLWRVGSKSSETRRLLDVLDAAFSSDWLFGAKFTSSDLWLTVQGPTFYGGWRSRIRHYRFDAERAQRTDPLAYGPRDFVAEWLDQPWSESVAWVETGSRTRFAQFHRWAGNAGVSATPIGPAHHCSDRPDLWQIRFDISREDKSHKSSEDTPFYFLVRYHPPDRLALVDVRDNPWPACREEDEGVDQGPRLVEFKHY